MSPNLRYIVLPHLVAECQTRSGTINLLPCSYYIELCTDVFGFNRTTIDASVSHMRQVFGGLTGYNATRIVFTNGASDPWTTLGFNTTVWNPNGISTLLIEGGSHCSDLNPPTTSDSEGLLNARQKIENLLDFWLD